MAWVLFLKCSEIHSNFLPTVDHFANVVRIMLFEYTIGSIVELFFDTDTNFTNNIEHMVNIY